MGGSEKNMGSSLLSLLNKVKDWDCICATPYTQTPVSGRIFDVKHMNKFFKKLYFAYQKKALYYQEKKQGKLKFMYQGAADSIGYNHLCLTNAQVNTRRDITIMFESAYVPSVQLLMTDDHRFLELVAEEGDVWDLFWRTALETFRVDLTLKVCPAENFLF